MWFWKDMGAALLGMLLGGMANMAVIALNMVVLAPPPAGMNFSDPEAMAAYVGGLPWWAFVVVMVAHLLQALVGALIAARFAVHGMPVAIFIATLTALGGLVNLMELPGPWWVWLELPLYFLVAWAAAHWELNRRPSE